MQFDRADLAAAGICEWLGIRAVWPFCESWDLPTGVACCRRQRRRLSALDRLEKELALVDAALDNALAVTPMKVL